MPHPRFRIRTLMTVIAVIGAEWVLAAWLCERRLQPFAQKVVGTEDLFWIAGEFIIRNIPVLAAWYLWRFIRRLSRNCGSAMHRRDARRALRVR